MPRAILLFRLLKTGKSAAQNRTFCNPLKTLDREATDFFEIEAIKENGVSVRSAVQKVE